MIVDITVCGIEGFVDEAIKPMSHTVTFYALNSYAHELQYGVKAVCSLQLII